MKTLIIYCLLTLLACNESVSVQYPITSIAGPKVEPLENFVTRVIDTCNTKLSPASRRAKASLFSTIVPRYLPSRVDQEMYSLLICIESKYDNTARSQAGAVGMAQIMPKYAQDFANLCELGKLDSKDVEDPIINLSLGACFFNSLLKGTNSTILAIAAYNAGANSSSVRELAKLGSPVPETASYVAKAALLKEKLNDKTDKGSVSTREGERVPDQRDAGSGTSSTPVPSE